LPDTNPTAAGFGKSMPVADNSAAAGRQQTGEWKLSSQEKSSAQ
jgi:hypothetical protein